VIPADFAPTPSSLVLNETNDDRVEERRTNDDGVADGRTNDDGVASWRTNDDGVGVKSVRD